MKFASAIFVTTHVRPSILSRVNHAPILIPMLALVRLLEIIGEAANGVSPELREKYPAIHWTGMTGMRNRLIHGYFDVNLDIVWQTVTKDLPPLAAQIERVLRESVEN